MTQKQITKPAAKTAAAKTTTKGVKVSEKSAKTADAISAVAKALEAAAPTKAVKKTAPAKAEVKKAVKTEKTSELKKAKAEQPPLQGTVLSKGSKMYGIAETARPGFGRALFAHTHAALQVTGMLTPSRPAVAKRVLTTIIGQRAIAHHLKERNLEDAADHTIRLSSAGLNKFRERIPSLDANLANGFMDLFVKGDVGKTGVAPANIFEFKP